MKIRPKRGILVDKSGHLNSPKIVHENSTFENVHENLPILKKSVHEMCPRNVSIPFLSAAQVCYSKTVHPDSSVKFKRPTKKHSTVPVLSKDVSLIFIHSLIFFAWLLICRDEWIPLFSDIYHGYSFFWIHIYLDIMDIKFLHYPGNG